MDIGDIFSSKQLEEKTHTHTLIYIFLFFFSLSFRDCSVNGQCDMSGILAVVSPKQRMISRNDGRSKFDQERQRSINA